VNVPVTTIVSDCGFGLNGRALADSVGHDRPGTATWADSKEQSRTKLKQTKTHCFPIDEFLTNGMQRELGTFPAVEQKLSSEKFSGSWSQ
jgi:hypothetical protein